MGTRRQLDLFYNSLNKLHSNIKFTIELESDNSINFLDLNITKNNNKLSFEIFHKPSQTDMVIHNSSAHPFSHKLAAFRSYIHGLVNVPMSQENFQIELNIIKQIAINNGYTEKGLGQELSSRRVGATPRLKLRYSMNLYFFNSPILGDGQSECYENLTQYS